MAIDAKAWVSGPSSFTSSKSDDIIDVDDDDNFPISSVFAQPGISHFVSTGHNGSFDDEEEDDIPISRVFAIPKSSKLVENRQISRDLDEEFVEGSGEAVGFQGFSNCDLVWVKAFANTWWPGLICAKEKHQVLVSLFAQETIEWFDQSKVLTFESHFTGKVKQGKRIRGFEEAVAIALEELRRQYELEFSCSCRSLFKSRGENYSGVDILGCKEPENYRTNRIDEYKNGVKPSELLGFVHKVAVMAWIDDSEAIGAVQAMAQVTAFRGNDYIARDWFYCETLRLSECNSGSDDTGGIQNERNYFDIDIPEEPLEHGEDNGTSGSFSDQLMGKSEACVTNRRDLSLLWTFPEDFEPLPSVLIGDVSRLGLLEKDLTNSKKFVEQDPYIENVMQRSDMEATNVRNCCILNSVDYSEISKIGFCLNNDIILDNDLEEDQIQEGIDSEHGQVNRSSVFVSVIQTEPDIDRILPHENESDMGKLPTEGIAMFSDHNNVVIPFDEASLSAPCSTKDGARSRAKNLSCETTTQSLHEMLKDAVVMDSDSIDDLEQVKSVSTCNVQNDWISSRCLNHKDMQPNDTFVSVCGRTDETKGPKTGKPQQETYDDATVLKSHRANYSEGVKIVSRSQRNPSGENLRQHLREMIQHLYCLALDPFYDRAPNLSRVCRALLRFKAAVSQNIPNLGTMKASCEYNCRPDSNALVFEQVESVSTSNVQGNNISSHSGNHIGMQLNDAPVMDMVSGRSDETNGSQGGNHTPCTDDAADKDNDFEGVRNVSNDLHVRNISQYSNHEEMQPHVAVVISSDRTTGTNGVRSSSIAAPTPDTPVDIHLGKRKLDQPSDLSHKLQKINMQHASKSSYVSGLSIDTPGPEYCEPLIILHMKFPKNFDLPSKQELERKFMIFGPLDPLGTKVFFYTGSGQVVFQHQCHAEAAVLYAKKKGLFGEANVRIWLSQSVKSASEAKNTLKAEHYCYREKGFPASSFFLKESNNYVHRLHVNAVPNYKSCLKKPDSLRQKERRGPFNVRFLTASRISSIAGSVIRKKNLSGSSSSHRQEIGPDISQQMAFLLKECNELVCKIKCSLGLDTYFSLFAHSVEALRSKDE
ncbi:hypothetical protein AMTRI_Chr01g127960 [Amborella trichopoda]